MMKTISPLVRIPPSQYKLDRVRTPSVNSAALSAASHDLYM